LIEIRRFAPPKGPDDFTPDRAVEERIADTRERDCSGGGTGAGRWSVGGRDSGLFWCSVGVGLKEIEWSNRAASLLVTAHGNGSTDLAAWWRQYRELIGASKSPPAQQDQGPIR
jgi:hypothetical protein